MIVLNLYTEKFKTEVEDLKLFDKDEDLYTINLKNFDEEKFCELLKKIVLSDNVITKKSEKLRYIIEKKIFHDFNQEITPIINHFIEYKFINLDGFATFVLSDYNYRVNEILYMLVKMSFPTD